MHLELELAENLCKDRFGEQKKEQKEEKMEECSGKSRVIKSLSFLMNM